MITDYQIIRNRIEEAIEAGGRNFILYPYGEYGAMAKQILNECFGIKECYIIDNKLSKFNSNIKSIDYCRNLDKDKYIVLFTCANPNVYKEVYNQLNCYFSERCIIKLFTENRGKPGDTRCGKYSYGPLCNHWLVESVGAFCGFAQGTDVVENHAIDYLSVHPFIHADKEVNPALNCFYDEYMPNIWHFPGIKPKGIAKKLTKVKIGNDVWLGKNVIITNGANIGNGVIAGAGAVITRDVPDYAMVVGVPAKIIRYRYTKEQIEKLNAIAWWDWTDEQIRARYDDLYMNVEDFIQKYFG